MAFTPTLSDIPVEGFTPTLSDIPNISASEELLNKASEMAKQPAYDGSDSWQQSAAKLGISAALPLLAPEFSLGNKLLSGVANAASRIGAGTAGNIAYNLPQVSSMDDLSTLSRNALFENAGLEALTAPLKFAGAAAELTNPLNYTADKTNQIRNEYNILSNLQKQHYSVPTERYGLEKVTNNPLNYLDYSAQEIKRFTPESRRFYNQFLEDPTFSNLHKLQSQMGRDINLINPRAKPNQYQTLSSARSAAKDKIQDYLSRDPEALENYNIGSHITRDYLAPYEANKNLLKIVSGTKDPSPNQLLSAIRKGREDIAYGKGENAIPKIPDSHNLTNHLLDIENRINRGQAISDLGGAIGGGILGELFHPGIGGALGGASTGALYSKFGNPFLNKLVQNPWLQRQAENLAPYYYTLGRAGTNAFNTP